jgi:hypothetical protein
MSAARFRRIALALPGAIESSHMGHPDFRVGGKVFATLGHPDAAWGTVMLSPDEQQVLVDAAPDIFRPVPGGWGKRGSTNVHLASADAASLKSALTMAWTRRAPKPRAKRSSRGA